jgi:hypothetical protein
MPVSIFDQLKDNLKSKNIVSFILPSISIYISLVIPHNELANLTFFIVLIPIFVYCRFDVRILIFYGIFLLALVSIIDILFPLSNVSSITNFVFYLLVDSVVCLWLIDVFKKGRTKINDNKDHF